MGSSLGLGAVLDYALYELIAGDGVLGDTIATSGPAHCRISISRDPSSARAEVHTMSKRATQRTTICQSSTMSGKWAMWAFPAKRRTAGWLARAWSVSAVLTLCGALSVTGAHAADIAIHMLDTSTNGPLAFDPPFVKATVGDTLVFTPSSKGHTTESLLVPDGATPWKSGYDQETRVTVDKEGVYLYGCEAHLRMGMVGVVQVGQPLNLEAAEKAAAAASVQFVMNKDRFATALAQVH